MATRTNCPKVRQSERLGGCARSDTLTLTHSQRALKALWAVGALKGVTDDERIYHHRPDNLLRPSIKLTIGERSVKEQSTSGRQETLAFSDVCEMTQCVISFLEDLGFCLDTSTSRL